MALQAHGEVREGGLPRRREDLEVAGTGQMGSALFRWQFAPAQLSAVLEHDWSCFGRRVFVDPERGEVTLMAPSGPHGETSRYAWSLVYTALRRRCRSRLSPAGGTTWSPPGSRRVEADESYYLGDVALRCLQVHRMDRPDLVDAFFDANPPQLVIEVERTHGDAGKPDVYRALGVAEMWRINQTGNNPLSVEILELQYPAGWRAVDCSTVLTGLTPALIGHVLDTARRQGAGVIPALLTDAGISG